MADAVALVLSGAAFALVAEMRVSLFLRRRRAARRRALRARPRGGNVRLLDDARRGRGEAG